MIYAVSGSQGSGKSSVLTELENRGYNVLKTKISRSILQEWGVTLEAVNSDVTLNLDFQNEIIRRKIMDEERATDEGGIWFTERTYLDSFVYFLFYFGKYKSLSRDVNNYYNRCKLYDNIYSRIFYLPSGKFEVVGDGVRNSNPWYALAVDQVLKFYLHRDVPEKMVELQELTVNGRVDKIINVVNEVDTEDDND